MIEKWMSQNRNVLVAGAVLAVGAGAVCAAVWRQMRPSASTFILEAYSNGLAEITSAELALQKTTSSNVKAFAQHMIDDHSDLNKELHAMADRKNLHLVDTKRLADKTRAFLLRHKEGQSFDEAYLEHEIRAHKQTIALFQRATHCKDSEVRDFAAVSLGKLDSHLKMTQKLLKAVQEYRVIKPIGRKSKVESTTAPSLSLGTAAETGRHPN